VLATSPEPEALQPPSAADLLDASAPAEWGAKARCNDGNGTLSFLFFSEDLIDIARAKAICSRCVVREPCLTGALERAEPWGVWGGELFVDGRVVANKRRRGRPPKTPRPEPVVDEVSLPPIAVRIA
jgi:WhiB family redox-sensing transcriptional regulator